MIPCDDLIAISGSVREHWLRRSASVRLAAMLPLSNLAAAAARAGRGVHGVGVGPKFVAGKPTNTLALRIYVVQKLAARRLSRADLLPQRLDGLPVDVVETPLAVFRSSPREARDPLCTGISIGRRNVKFGTVGGFWRCRVKPGPPLVLSNAHVLAGRRGVENDPVYQPGPGDAEGKPLRQVGTLLRSWRVEPGNVVNRVDAAVASLSGVKHDLALPGHAGRITTIGTATRGTIVCKFGRTTGYTEGVVTDLHYGAWVGFDPATDEKAYFMDQIRIERRFSGEVFADAGDSGAIVLEQGTGRAVGLFFAGPPDGSYGLANHIGDVTERLDIDLLV